MRRVSMVQLVLGLLMVLVGSVTASLLYEPDRDPEPTADIESSPGEHWIDVNRQTGVVTLYIGSDPVAVLTAKVGADMSLDGYYATAPGEYRVFALNANLTPTSFYDGGYLTHWVGFDPERRNGFHSPVRDEHGVAIPNQPDTTLGCVRLSEADAVTVFAFAEMGMRVVVHD